MPINPEVDCREIRHLILCLKAKPSHHEAPFTILAGFFPLIMLIRRLESGRPGLEPKEHAPNNCSQLLPSGIFTCLIQLPKAEIGWRWQPKMSTLKSSGLESVMPGAFGTISQNCRRMFTLKSSQVRERFPKFKNCLKYQDLVEYISKLLIKPKHPAGQLVSRNIVQ